MVPWLWVFVLDSNILSYSYLTWTLIKCFMEINLCSVYRTMSCNEFIHIGSHHLKWIFISYGFYETSCVFYIPEPLAKGYKTHKEFHKYRMKWKFISYSFYHMTIPKNTFCISISWKSMYFEKIPRENLPEASRLTRRHNAPSNEVAPNWCKKCYVSCVLLENLWNVFMKGQIMW